MTNARANQAPAAGTLFFLDDGQGDSA